MPCITYLSYPPPTPFLSPQPSAVHDCLVPACLASYIARLRHPVLRCCAVSVTLQPGPCLANHHPFGMYLLRR